jgi:hypothetical protein
LKNFLVETAFVCRITGKADENVPLVKIFGYKCLQNTLYYAMEIGKYSLDNYCNCEEFKSKKVELDKLCEDKDIRLSIYKLDDLVNYKEKENCYNNKKESYYLKEKFDYNERIEVYNKLVLMGINSEFNIEELINSFVNELVNK